MEIIKIYNDIYFRTAKQLATFVRYFIAYKYSGDIKIFFPDTSFPDPMLILV